MIDDRECLCPRECDCQCPEPEVGAALVSNYCPIHNVNPRPSGICPATVHWFDESYTPGTDQCQTEIKLSLT